MKYNFFAYKFTYIKTGSSSPKKDLHKVEHITQDLKVIGSNNVRENWPCYRRSGFITATNPRNFLWTLSPIALSMLLRPRTIRNLIVKWFTVQGNSWYLLKITKYKGEATVYNNNRFHLKKHNYHAEIKILDLYILCKDLVRPASDDRPALLIRPGRGVWQDQLLFLFL